MTRLKVIRTILSAAIVLVPAEAAATQAPKQKPRANARKRAERAQTPSLDPTQQKAVGVLEAAAADVRRLENPVTRTHLQIVVADELWDFNEAGARAGFERSFEDAADVDNEVQKRLLRMDVVRRVWLRSPVLAQQMLKKMAAEKGQAGPERETAGKFAVQFGAQSPDPERQQELLLAGSLIQDHPEQAAALINRVVQDGPTIGAIGQLSRLRERRPELADRIFLQTVAQLSSMPVSTALAAATGMGDYVLAGCALAPQEQTINGRVGREFYQAGLLLLRRSLTQPPPVVSDQPKLQERAVQLQQSAQTMLALNLAGLARRYGTPEAAELYGLYQSLLGRLSANSQQAIAFMEKAQNSDDRLELIFKQVSSMPDQAERDTAIVNFVETALKKPTNSETLAKLGRKIDSIKTPALRDRGLSLYKLKEAELAVGLKDLDRALKLAGQISDPLLRAEALTGIAKAARDAGDSFRATEVANESLRQAVKADDSLRRPALLFGVAQLLTDLKEHERAFQALEMASDALGRLSTDDFSSRALDSTAPEGQFNFAANFGQLAKVDFDRSVLIADGIRWRELRLAATVAACGGVLERKGVKR